MSTANKNINVDKNTDLIFVATGATGVCVIFFQLWNFSEKNANRTVGLIVKILETL